MVAEVSSTLGMIFPHAFFNSNKIESIFAETNFKKNKLLICASCNSHKSNISNHLHHLDKGLDNYIANYDHILLLGDFNFQSPI